MEKEYKEGDTIYILMEAIMASTLMDDWVNHNYGCDMLVHRSKKHPGCVVSRPRVWYRQTESSSGINTRK